MSQIRDILNQLVNVLGEIRDPLEVLAGRYTSGQWTPDRYAPIRMNESAWKNLAKEQQDEVRKQATLEQRNIQILPDQPYRTIE